MDFAEWLSTLTWGSIADWLVAVGTLAAFLIAAVTYLRSYFEARKSQARRITIRDSETRWDAAGKTIPTPGKVSGVKMNMPTELGTVPTFAEDAAVVTVGIHNGTDEAIGPIRIEILVEGAESDVALASEEWRTVQPGHERWSTLAFKDRWNPSVPSFLTRVTFRDAAGRWWQRTEGGPVSGAPRASQFVFTQATGRRLTVEKYVEAAQRHNRNLSDSATPTDAPHPLPRD